MSRDLTKIIVMAALLLGVNFAASLVFKRFDLTQDKRYTLSETSINIIDKIDENAVIRVYLEGDFPSEFKRLQIETRQHLEELKALNPAIKFRFVDPLDMAEELMKKGLEPSRLSVQENGKVSEAVIFPWATLTYGNKVENISLLTNQASGGQEAQLQGSIENLEFSFTNALHKVTSDKQKTIAIIKGNMELQDIYLASMLEQLAPYYRLAPFTLDSVGDNPEETLAQLNDFDLAIIAKPNERFSEAEKFTLDQFIMNGGRSLWLIDNVTAELDSLMMTGRSLAFNKDLNLTDQLFSYGVRVNYDLIRDIYSSTIRLAAGNSGDQTQFQDFLWHYYPVITSINSHPINKNLDPVSLRFANTLDTLKNSAKKTVLLQSSEFSKPMGVPREISLEEVSKKPVQEDYNNGNQILGVLLEGEFSSAYAQRVKPFRSDLIKEKSEANKMIVISDGDIIANQLAQGKPLELGLDKWTNIRYGNAAFLMNAINYMLDDEGLMALRSKSLKIKFLDKEKAFTERSKWQMINVLSPLILLLIFGLGYRIIRKKKYSTS